MFFFFILYILYYPANPVPFFNDKEAYRYFYFARTFKFTIVNKFLYRYN